jgi:transcription-repair coupling factor (superfamily II helicase)
VADLSMRLNLYRRLAELDDESEIDGFGAEMVDRFANPEGLITYIKQRGREARSVPT